MKSYTYNFSFSAMLITLRHTGECDPQDVGNVASDQYPTEHKPAYLLPPLRGKAGWGYNVKWISSLLLMTLIFSLSTSNSFAADDLGRLFTTPQQRQTLEKLRNQKPETEIKIPDITFEEPVVEEEKPVIGGITVNGLVYRKGGKSTAWINSANTFEGTFGNQYILIDANNIKPDDVEIVIPVNEKNVKLKTGQTYDPEADQIISPGYQDN